MKYHGKTAAILVLLVLLVSVTVAAGEKSVPVGNPEAVSGKDPSKGIRHLFINKPPNQSALDIVNGQLDFSRKREPIMNLCPL